MLQSLNLRLLLDMLSINSTKALLNLNKETLKIDHKESVTASSCVDCVLITVQALDCMALAINFLSNRGVRSDVTLIDTLDQYSILNFKRFMQHMVVTKSSTDDAELVKLRKNTLPNTLGFKNWCTTIEGELYQKISADGMFPLVYVIRASKAPVKYVDVDQNNTLI